MIGVLVDGVVFVGAVAGDGVADVPHGPGAERSEDAPREPGRFLAHRSDHRKSTPSTFVVTKWSHLASHFSTSRLWLRAYSRPISMASRLVFLRGKPVISRPA